MRFSATNVLRSRGRKEPVRRTRSAERRRLVGLVPDQGDDHAVEVEEEQDQVEPELGEGFLWHTVLVLAFR